MIGSPLIESSGTVHERQNQGILCRVAPEAVDGFCL